MLDYSDAPYQFFGPEPWRPVMALSRPLNRFLLRHDLGIRQQEISGEVEAVKSLISRGDRVMFTPNHPTRTDPQFVGEVQKQLGTHPSFMAAYDVFLESRIQRWFMQKNGSFSVDREGNDRQAMSTAIDILKKGEMSLTIFPEGNTYQLNDRITPFLDGPSFLAAKAQQALGDEAGVWIVPVSLKFTFLADVRNRIWKGLVRIGKESGFSGHLDRQDPIGSVLAVGGHLISQYLSQKTARREKFDLPGKSPEKVRNELFGLSSRLVGELEKELTLESDPDTFILDRIRRIRTKIHQLRINQSYADSATRRKYADLADRAIFTFRLLAYVLPYFSEKPTLDRFGETVFRMREDHHSSKDFRPWGPRKAMARIGEPISMRDRLARTGGKVKDAIPGITRQMEVTIQSGIDQLNEANATPGSRFVFEG